MLLTALRRLTFEPSTSACSWVRRSSKVRFYRPSDGRSPDPGTTLRIGPDFNVGVQL
jgi:hypothetical protein